MRALPLAGSSSRRRAAIRAMAPTRLARLVASWIEPLALAQADLEAAAEAHGTSLAACIDRLCVRLGDKAAAVEANRLRGAASAGGAR